MEKEKLAEKQRRTKGTISTNVTTLEKSGYIYREKRDDNAKVVPAAGVYAVKVYGVEGENGKWEIEKCLPHSDNSQLNPKWGMANFGGQPTFGLERTVFEVNVFDYDGDLYGKVLTVEFVDRIRDVRRFEGVEQLVSQLEEDRRTAREKLTINN